MGGNEKKPLFESVNNIEYFVVIRAVRKNDVFPHDIERVNYDEKLDFIAHHHS